MTYPCHQCNMDDGSPICLQDERCPGRATAVARDALKLSEHMNDQNNALRLCVSDLTAVILRMAAGIAHLSELARQWEPDHSSGSDRRGWVLAKDARNDALRLLQEHSQRIWVNQTATAAKRLEFERAKRVVESYGYDLVPREAMGCEGS